MPLATQSDHTKTYILTQLGADAFLPPLYFKHYKKIKP